MPRAYNKPEFGPCAPVAAALLTDWGRRYLLDSRGSELYMSSRLYNRARGASGRRRSRQTKRSAAVLPDSARAERTDPFRRTETGRVNAIGARNSGAAGR